MAVVADKDAFTEERIEIPFSLPSTSSEGAIVGTLTTPRRPSYPPTQFVLIMHGFGGHKNYCYQKLLAHRLAQDDLGFCSFRFDFRNCGESAEIESSAGRTLDDDISDIRDVVTFFRATKGMEVVASVAHSRGNIASFIYSLRYNHTFPYYVNCSSRFRTELIIEKAKNANPNWEQDGGYWATVPRYMKTKRVLIPASETLSLAEPDMTSLVNLSECASFLSVYGLNDGTLFVEDSAKYANLLGARHTLHYVRKGDHNFYGLDPESGERVSYNPEVVRVIADWLSPESRRQRFVKQSSRALKINSRFKNIEGVVNFRDLGGWKVPAKGKKVRSGMIYRAASLHSLTENGERQLKALGIAKAFDLRSASECEKNGIYSIEGIERIHTPLGKEPHDQSALDTSTKLLQLSTGVDGYINLYREILQDGKLAYRTIFEHVLKYPSQPFVVHCTAGKDRTGVFCALVLELCGIDRDVISREYELTRIGIASKFEQVIQNFSLKYPEVTDRAKLESMISSTYETMYKTLVMLDEEFGGVQFYLTEYLGFSQDEISQIRDNLLEG
ncbi:protein-tyrosine phosphatase-like protein [Myxozyma melibiosi]|uniref:Protein-tyrosine phosphatase-like protein n=1 Tax=Myxozyma melibiosi TaxID=54550 RepID=A0ABR1F2U6_9ASCO